MAAVEFTYARAWKDLEKRVEDSQLIYEIHEKPNVELAEMIHRQSSPSLSVDSDYLGKLQFLLQQLAVYPAVTGALEVRNGTLSGWKKIRTAFQRIGLSVKISIIDYIIQSQSATRAKEQERVQRKLASSATVTRTTENILREIRERGSQNVVSIPPVRPRVSCDAFMVTLLQAVIFGESQVFERLMCHLRKSLSQDCVMVKFDQRLWQVLVSICFRWAFPNEDCPFEMAIRPTKFRTLPSEVLLLTGWERSMIAIGNLGVSARRQGLSPLGIDPCEVFPIEILAIQKIRLSLNLPVAQISHPLLDSPLHCVPDDIVIADDPIIHSVEEHLRYVLPSFDTLWDG